METFRFLGSSSGYPAYQKGPTEDVQCPAKVFTRLELFHILSCFKHTCKCILLGFYVIVQHEVGHNCEVEGN